VDNNEDIGIGIGIVLEGKYRVDHVVGEGGMGTIYGATHLKLKRKVAIKTLHSHFVSNENVTARFFREAQLAASIGHDNICEVTDIGTLKNGSNYLVMPLLEGCSLGNLINQDIEIPISKLVDIICQTLSALEAAHNAHIVHRDLKPDNIFVTKVGDRQDFVKLLDFGISKILDQDSFTELTKTGTVLGTSRYMSPEQARGAKDIDHRADIYAIGVILYKALTKKCPFEGDSYNEILYKILVDSFQPPRSINKFVPPAVEKVILKAMSRHPKDRYQNASEMRIALKTTLGENDKAATIVKDQSQVALNNEWAFSEPSLNSPSKWSIDMAKEGLPSDRQKLRSSSGRKMTIAILIFIAALIIAVLSLMESGGKTNSTKHPREDSLIKKKPSRQKGGTLLKKSKKNAGTVNSDSKPEPKRKTSSRGKQLKQKSASDTVERAVSPKDNRDLKVKQNGSPENDSINGPLKGLKFKFVPSK
jgi:serine/threonine protein kinase